MSGYAKEEVPLVIGALRGRRNFKVMEHLEADNLADAKVVLTSPSHSDFTWFDGENIALCGCMRYSSTNPETEKHTPGEMHAGCGFYAYTNHKYFEYEHNTQAIGVVEGYGRMTVGDLGFRAQKARILGISFKESLGFLERLLFEKEYPNVQIFDTPDQMFEEIPLVGVQGEIKIPKATGHAIAFRANKCPDCSEELQYLGRPNIFECTSDQCPGSWTAEYVMRTIHEWRVG